MPVDLMAEFELAKEQIIEKLENAEWRTNTQFYKTNQICPVCFASIPVDYRHEHIAWHKSELETVSVIANFFYLVGGGKED